MAARSAVDSTPDDLRSLRPFEVDSAQVADIVTQVLRTLDGDITMADVKVYHELEELARFIDGARAEIAALCPHEINATHIPMATDELDAIVGATEEATHSIMEAAERIEGVADGLGDDEAATVLTEAVTAIYEACSFQDITGQRVTKVVKALQQIETKVDALVSAFGDEIRRHRNQDSADANETASPTPDPLSEEDELRLLNGPQSGGEGQTQEEIDALFASLD